MSRIGFNMTHIAMWIRIHEMPFRPGIIVLSQFTAVNIAFKASVGHFWHLLLARIVFSEPPKFNQNIIFSS